MKGRKPLGPCRNWIALLHVNSRGSLPFPFSRQYSQVGLLTQLDMLLATGGSVSFLQPLHPPNSACSLFSLIISASLAGDIETRCPLVTSWDVCRLCPSTVAAYITLVSAPAAGRAFKESDRYKYDKWMFTYRQIQLLGFKMIWVLCFLFSAFLTFFKCF